MLLGSPAWCPEPWPGTEKAALVNHKAVHKASIDHRIGPSPLAAEIRKTCGMRTAPECARYCHAEKTGVSNRLMQTSIARRPQHEAQ